MLKMFGIVTICAAVSAYGQSTGTLVGRVLAEGSQQPLLAAVMIVSAGAGVRLKTIEVDEHGNFSIEAPLGGALVIARANGYASEQREIFVRPGRANPTLNFSLPAAGSVSGRVVDLTGSGVGGARVWVQYPGEARAWRPAEEAGGEPTDPLGNFTIPAVPQGRPFVLHVEREKWLPSSSRTIMFRSPELQGVLLLLNRHGASGTGRVLDSGGRPVAGASVQLRATPADNELPDVPRNSLAFSRAMNRTTISGEDGSYSFEGLPAGRIVITTQQQNRRGASDAEITSGAVTNVDLSLR